MFQTMIVIDDFYAEPEKVRQSALGMTYPEPVGTVYYPGRTSQEFMLPPNCDEMFRFILREKVTGVMKRNHGHFRFSLAGAHRPAEVHIDPGMTWAGIVYLTLDKDCQGGTDLFRHKRYGTDRAPTTDEEAQRIYGMDTCKEVVRKLIYDDGHHLDRWDHLTTIPMKFNRCALFRPWMWHTSGVDFGDTIENGRLVQLLFFAAADPTNAMTTPEF